MKRYIKQFNTRFVISYFKLSFFYQDVHSVVWCPTKGNKVLRPDDTKETFLATSGRDKTIKIWAAEGGKCVLQAKLPGNTGFHRPRSGHHQEDKRSTWVALHWLDECRILSSGLSGELVSWEVIIGHFMQHNTFVH